MTKEAEDLVQEEEEAIIEQHSHKAAELVTRMLMMSVDKRLALDKIAHFRRDLGLPMDFRKHWARRELKAGTLEFNKRAVAVMHELLSFTIGKRLVTDYLTHFRKEFVMPQKLMRKKKETMDALNDLQEFVDDDFFENESEDESVQVENNKQTMDCLEGDFLENESEMEIDEVCSAYRE
ncbi:hypothetical protein HAX54_051977 [Datura stramonium]|uniref:PORR domain-containing protein n=1 Tax=Datura stramonium TaxID=4076 RepID=A0ABS8WN22_DATST|nr:hypothetical protein [Datura stramonium]